jgi:hypothetical protein
MLFGVLFNFNTWDFTKGVAINVFWIFWYLPKLIPWPILLFFVAVIAVGVLRKYLEWKAAATAERQAQLAEGTKLDLLRKIEENTRQKLG